LVDVSCVAQKSNIKELLCKIFDKHIVAADLISLIKFDSQTAKYSPKTVFSLVLKQQNVTQLRNQFVYLKKEMSAASSTRKDAFERALRVCKNEFMTHEAASK
jgi:hypothetical protein